MAEKKHYTLVNDFDFHEREVAWLRKHLALPGATFPYKHRESMEHKLERILRTFPELKDE